MLWTVSILVFAAAPSSPIAIVAQFFGGMLFISYVSMAQSLVQLEAPAASRGRIIGVFSMALNGLKIGSGVTVGFLGAVIGIHWSLALSCLLLLVCMLPLLRYVAAGRKSAAEPVQVG